MLLPQHIKAQQNPIRVERKATRDTAGTALHISGLILGLRPANERRRYFVTTSLIGWAQA